MSHKEQLRGQRVDTVINTISKHQEVSLVNAVDEVKVELLKKFEGIKLDWVSALHLVDVVNGLRKSFPEISFAEPQSTSTMKPDGGILYMVDKSGNKYPILITEKKNQGTNDIRKSEGKKKQAKGNAIERLGKNVIGLRTALLTENIFPFVCFGDGCDFADGSSILDRVLTIAMFGELNVEHVTNESNYFNRGTFYFRSEQWTQEEMRDKSLSVAIKSVHYYFSKYGEQAFV